MRYINIYSLCTFVHIKHVNHEMEMRVELQPQPRFHLKTRVFVCQPHRTKFSTSFTIWLVNSIKNFKNENFFNDKSLNSIFIPFQELQQQHDLLLASWLLLRQLFQLFYLMWNTLLQYLNIFNVMNWYQMIYSYKVKIMIFLHLYLFL